jgi:hypothetical protein
MGENELSLNIAWSSFIIFSIWWLTGFMLGLRIKNSDNMAHNMVSEFIKSRLGKAIIQNKRSLNE